MKKKWVEGSYSDMCGSKIHPIWDGDLRMICFWGIWCQLKMLHIVVLLGWGLWINYHTESFSKKTKTVTPKVTFPDSMSESSKATADAVSTAAIYLRYHTRHNIIFAVRDCQEIEVPWKYSKFRAPKGLCVTQHMFANIKICFIIEISSGLVMLWRGSLVVNDVCF